METTAYASDLLKRTGLFPEERLSALLDAARKSDASVTEIVVRDAYAPEDVFLQALSKLMNIPFLRIDGPMAAGIPQEALDKLPPKIVFQDRVMPLSLENGMLLVATTDPLNPNLLDRLRFAADGRVRLALSTTTDIETAAKKRYGLGAETVDRIKDDGRFDIADETHLGKVDLSEGDQEASIVKFVNEIIMEAARQSATDIHFEPMESDLRIRYRVDGVLHKTDVPPQLNRFKAAILSRIKVMANMDIAEKRLPMDGRIGLRIQGQDVDIRVSTMPTVYGESVSLRLLRGKAQFIGLKELGMSERDSRLMQKLILRPNGIILVTGPTGSGKSTSLYAFLHEINKPGVRILTAEEPIEYEMPGINQVLVRPEIGLTFERILRSFLRQDPNIIMVGEIRDRITAEIAVQASLTGHLVFSTLHTNDAAGAFTRLLDMKVEPYLLASAVEAVVAQRLVRRLCVHCKKPLEPDMDFLQQIGFPLEQMGTGSIHGTGACEKCRGTGFSGRNGIFEVLPVTEGIRSLVIGHSSTNEIKQTGIAAGMCTLRDDGWLKVLEGVTTLEEVLRATEENE